MDPCGADPASNKNSAPPDNNSAQALKVTSLLQATNGQLFFKLMLFPFSKDKPRLNQMKNCVRRDCKLQVHILYGIPMNQNVIIMITAPSIAFKHTVHKKKHSSVTL